ncbi:rhodopsin-like [Bacillus rossius redtenbacheri]|uniref:rhodopsin-like n=1 Tax=Bacillus rossius redtenbacheri TaxID=93214 RepID=UPI002FDD0FE6
MPERGEEGDDGLLMAPESYVATAVVLFFIGFFGFFCNLLVIVLMCREKQLWTPLNVILFNLVCSDFSVSILGNPFTLVSAIFRRWVFGRAMCVVYGFFMSLLGITSITTLMVLSFERYVMISKPFYSRQLSQRGAVLLIAAIWLYSLMLTIPPLVGWGDYVNEAANISCSVNWETRTLGATTYIVFLFAMGLVVPVSVILFSYLNIIFTMKRSTMRMGRVTKAESRVALMIAVMIVSFMVAWTPYSVLALLIAFGDPSTVTPGLAVVPALVAKSSICYNPVIYVGLNTQFRSAWRKLLGQTGSADVSQEPGGGGGNEQTALSPPPGAAAASGGVSLLARLPDHARRKHPAKSRTRTATAAGNKHRGFSVSPKTNSVTFERTSAVVDIEMVCAPAGRKLLAGESDRQ